MSHKNGKSGNEIPLDEPDRKILRLLQQDSTTSLEQLAKKTGISRTAVWNRIQRLLQDKIILKPAAIVDAGRVGLKETFFVVIKTSQHDASWLAAFKQAVHEMPEIAEAHRLAGEMDYILKVQVVSTTEYDEFYQRLIAKITIDSVTSCLSMEILKHETTVPL